MPLLRGRESRRRPSMLYQLAALPVEPAASLLMHFSGDELVVINREPTPADEKATLLIRGDVAEVFGELEV